MLGTLKSRPLVAAVAATMMLACPAASWSAAACRLEIEGIWQPGTPPGDAPPMLLSFAADGSVTILEPSADTPAWAFEQLAAVGYELVPRSAPERIVFDVLRGNDLFAKGTAVWEIGSYGDERFAVRPESASGEEREWLRVQTRRYFLTLAARRGRAESGGPAAFVMWTKLDGQRPWFEAMGAYTVEADDEAPARFGRVRQELAEAFARQSSLDSDVMLRVELNEAEYLRTRRVLEAWDLLIRTGLLADDDPYRQAMDLIAAALASANRCALKIQAAGVDLSMPAEGSETARLRERPAQVIGQLRRINERVHVADKAFPFAWRPAPVVPPASRP